MESGASTCTPRSGVQSGRDIGDQNHAGVPRLHLARGHRHVAERFRMHSLCCGLHSFSASETPPNAPKICSDNAAAGCKCAHDEVSTSRQQHVSCGNCQNSSCDSLKAVRHGGMRDRCSVSRRVVPPAPRDDPARGDSSCSPWSGSFWRGICSAPRSVQHNVSSAADRTGNTEMRASLELFLSTQRLDILHSLSLVRWYGADPFFPVRQSSGGDAGIVADDCCAGSGLFSAASEQRGSNRGKLVTDFFLVPLAIRTAQRLASMLRSSPLQLLYCRQRSITEETLSDSTGTTSERQQTQHRVALYFPPEPSEKNVVFVMRCLFTWGATASHQLGYEVFSSAVGKLDQPPRAIAFCESDFASGAVINGSCSHACDPAPGVAHPISADGVAVAAVREIPYANSISRANVTEKGLGCITHTNISLNAGTTLNATYNRYPRVGEWGQSDGGSRYSGRRSGPVMGSLQVQFVRCGPSISLAVTLDNRVWVWGKNADGKRGLTAVPVALEIPDLLSSSDLCAGTSVGAAQNGASRLTEVAAEATETVAAGGMPAGAVGCATELLGPRHRGLGDVGLDSGAVHEGVLKDVLLRVLDAAVGADHCLLLVDVLRMTDKKSRTCTARQADSSNLCTQSHISAERREHDVDGNSTGIKRRSRVRGTRSTRVEGGLLLASDPSEMVSFRELEATDEEGDEEAYSASVGRRSGSSAATLVHNAGGIIAPGCEKRCAAASTAGESTFSSSVRERRLYVWGSNGCHQLGFAHNLSQAAGCRMDSVSASLSSPNSSSVSTASSSSCPSPSCGPFTRVSPLGLPDSKGIDLGVIVDTAESGKMASSAAVCEVPSYQGTDTNGSGNRQEASEREFSKQQWIPAEPTATTGKKRLHAPATGAKAGREARGGSRRQTEFDAFAVYTPVLLTSAVSSELSSSAGKTAFAIANNGASTEDARAQGKQGNASEYPYTIRRSVCGGEPARPGPPNALLKGLQLQPCVTAVAAGWTHSLLMLQDGRVYAFGDNSHGQCARPPSVTAVSSPTLVTQLPVSCAIAAGERTNVAISVPPQSTFIWGGSPIPGSALLAVTAASPTATSEGTAAQQRSLVPQKQQSARLACVGCRASVASSDDAAAGPAGGPGAIAPKKRVAGNSWAFPGSPACIGDGFICCPSCAGGRGSCPPSGTAPSSSCPAEDNSSLRKISGSSTSYLAYFTPLRLRGSSNLRAAGYFIEGKAAGGAQRGCSTIRRDVPVAEEAENSWHVHPAARHCPVLRPESITVSDSFGMAVGIDERLYAWHCSHQRPCILRPVVAHVSPSPLGSCVTDASGSHSISPLSSAFSSAEHRCCCLSPRCSFDGSCCSSLVSSSSTSATWGLPPSSAQLSPGYTSDYNFQRPTSSSVDDPKSCSAEPDAQAMTLPSVEHSGARSKEAGLHATAFASSSFYTCLQAQQPRCRIRQLLVTTTRVFLLTEDGLLFTATPPLLAGVLPASANTVAGGSTLQDSRLRHSCSRPVQNSFQQGGDDQRQPVAQQRNFQCQQTRKEQQRARPDRREDRKAFHHMDPTVEECVDRPGEPTSYVLHFYPVRGLASVQQVSGSDIHAAAVVAMFSPSFPPFDVHLSPASSESMCSRCNSDPSATSNLPLVSAKTNYTEVPTCASTRSRVPLPCFGSIETLPPSRACTGFRGSCSAETRVSSVSATPSAPPAMPAAAVSSRTVRAGGDAPTRLARREIITVSNGGSPSGRSSLHMAPHCSPNAQSPAAAGAFRSLTISANAELTADFFASSPAGESSRQPACLAEGGALRHGSADLTCPTSVCAGPAEPVQEEVPAADTPATSARALTSAGVPNPSATAAFTGLSVAANTGSARTVPSHAASLDARTMAASDRLSCANFPEVKPHSFVKAPSAAVGACATPPSLAAFAARALLRVKDPLPPSLPFMLYVVTPAALCVRDLSLFDFCCLYLLFNLPLLFAALSHSLVPAPEFAGAASYMATEHQPAAKKGSIGRVFRCRCSSGISTWCCNSSSSNLSSCSTTDASTSTGSLLNNRSKWNSSAICGTSTSASSAATDSSHKKTGLNPLHIRAAEEETDEQLLSREVDYQELLRHVPAAVGMQHFVRGIIELLSLRGSSGYRGVFLEEKKHNCVHMPCHPASGHYCWRQRQTEQREGLWNACAGSGICTPAAVDHRRLALRQHVHGGPAEALWVVRQGNASDAVEAPEGEAGSLLRGAMSLAAAARQHGVWWEEEEGIVDDVRRGRRTATSNSAADRPCDGEPHETFGSNPCPSPGWDICARAGGAATEHCAAEMAALLDILRIAAGDYLSDYICLPVSGEGHTTEEDVLDSHGRSTCSAFSGENPFPEHQDGLFHQEGEKLRELFSARLAIAGAADHFVERLTRQPLLYLLQRRASDLMEGYGNCNDVFTRGRGLGMAEGSGCGCASSFERQLLLSCWPNMHQSPLDSEIVYPGLPEAAEEEHAYLRTTMKSGGQEHAVQKDRAKQPQTLSKKGRNQRPLATEEKVGQNNYQTRTTKSSDGSGAVVAGAGGESGGTPAMSVGAPSTAAGAPADANKRESAPAATSAAKEELSVLGEDAERVENRSTCQFSLHDPPVKNLRRRELKTSNAYVDCKENLEVKTTGTTADGTDDCLPWSVSTTKNTFTEHRIVLNSSGSSTAFDNPATLPASASERGASRAHPCATAMPASPTDSISRAPNESLIAPSTSSSGATTIPTGQRSTWVRICDGTEAAGKGPANSLSGSRPSAAGCASQMTCTFPAVADETGVTVEGAFNHRGAFADSDSSFSASQSCGALPWREVPVRMKQRKKDGAAPCSTTEKTGDVFNSRGPDAAGVYCNMVSAGSKDAVPKSPATRNTAAAGRRGTLPTFTEAVAFKGSDAVTNATSTRSSARGICSSMRFTSSPSEAYQSDALVAVSALPHTSNSAGAPAAGSSVAVSVEDRRPALRCPITLNDFLVPNRRCEVERKQKAGRKGGREHRDEKYREESEIGPPQPSGNSGADALLQEKPRWRGWGDEEMSRGSVNEEGSRRNTGTTSGINGEPISSNTDIASNSDTSGVCREHGTDMANASYARSGMDGSPLRPQSLAEVMREEEELRRQKQLKRQWQLEQELLHSAKNSSRRSEPPVVLLRVKGSVHSVTAFAEPERVHKYKGGESKHICGAGRLLAQITAADDALWSSSALCDLDGNNTGVSRSSRCGTSSAQPDSCTSSNMVGDRGTSSGSSNRISNSNSNGRTTHEARRVSSFAEESTSLEIVGTCTRRRVARASDRSRQVRSDGASYNCWGLEAALRAQGDGAIDLMEVQRQQLQDRLAEQQQRDDEADLQEALWLIAQMEERERKEAEHLETQIQQAAAAAATGAERIFSTAGVPLPAQPAASTSRGRRRAADASVDFFSVSHAVVYGGLTSPTAACGTSTRKSQRGPPVDMCSDRAAMYTVHNARRGRRTFPQQSINQEQRGRYRKQQELPQHPSYPQQHCQQQAAEQHVGASEQRVQQEDEQVLQ